MNAKRMIKVWLELDEDEAKYLMGLTQNYLGDGEETPNEARIRAAIFTELRRAVPRSEEDK